MSSLVGSGNDAACGVLQQNATRQFAQHFYNGGSDSIVSKTGQASGSNYVYERDAQTTQNSSPMDLAVTMMPKNAPVQYQNQMALSQRLASMTLNQPTPEWSSEFKLHPSVSHSLELQERERMEAAFRTVPHAPSWQSEFNSYARSSSAVPISQPMQELFDSQFHLNEATWQQQFQQAATGTLQKDDAYWEKAFAEARQLHGNVQFREPETKIPDEDFWSDAMDKAWEQATDLNINAPGVDYATPIQERAPPRYEYRFEVDNPYLHENQNLDDLRLEATRLLSQGHLTLSCLALEALLQRQGEDAETWTQLGLAQAENEKENPAMAALQRAVELEQQQQPATMGPASLELAVSYTNEELHQASLTLLDSWLRHHYPTLAPTSPFSETRDSQAVLRAFARAAATPRGQHDANVQVALGVMSYNTGSYDRASDCFRTALQSRPNDHRLWNRLGATLANSGGSHTQEARGAYERALELRPNFVRARHNLGVSHLNAGQHSVAARHFAEALSLSLESSPRQPVHDAAQLWSTLRNALWMLDRRDWVERCDQRDLQVLNEVRSELQ